MTCGRCKLLIPVEIGVVHVYYGGDLGKADFCQPCFSRLRDELPSRRRERYASAYPCQPCAACGRPRFHAGWWFPPSYCSPGCRSVVLAERA